MSSGKEEGGLSAPLSRFAGGKTLPPEDIFRQKKSAHFLSLNIPAGGIRGRGGEVALADLGQTGEGGGELGRFIFAGFKIAAGFFHHLFRG